MLVTRTRRWVAVVTGALTALALVGVPSASASHATTPTTYRGHVFNSGASTPSADKPQSKLWFAGGTWWGVLLESSGRHTVHELRDHAWRSTGVVVDDRVTSTADALWDGSRLYTASRTSSGALELNRLSYAPATRQWSVDSGFPRTIASGGSESTTVAQDTRGRLWVTYTQGSVVWVLHSTTDDATWSAPFRLPGADTSVASDDISAVVAFSDKIGVMWSDQPSDAFRFAVHPDSADPGSGWTFETPLAGSNMADDHINVKTLLADGNGRVHAAVKTSQGDGGEPSGSPSIAVLTRSSAGSWSAATAGVVGDSLTRPALLIDESAGRLHLLMTAPESGGGGTIYSKTAPLSDIRFGNGRGDPFISWPGAKVNNVTTTKDPVNATTGVVALAVDSATRTYYHAELSPGGGSAPPPPGDTTAPSAPTGLTATPASTSTVDLRWTASTDGTGVTGYVVSRDGTEIARPTGTTWSDTGLTASTTYSWVVRAVDAAGNVSAASAPATATTPAQAPPPSGSGTIALVGAAAAPSTGTTPGAARPAGVAAGHVLVASVDVRGAPTITAPAGWQLLRLDAAGTTMRKATYVKVAGGAEPATYTWTLSRSQSAVVTLAAYSGVSTDAPVDAVGGQVGSSSASVVAPSVTTSTTGTRLVGLFGLARAATFTPPTGMAERAEATAQASYSVSGQVSDEPRAASGATGSRSATASGSAVGIGHLVALRAGVATEPPPPAEEPPPPPEEEPPAPPAEEPPPPAEEEPTGTIALRGATAAGNAGTASVTGARPAGTAAGDVLVASVDVRGRPAITAPAGWQLVRYDEAGSSMRKATYVKVAGASEPASWTWQLSRAEGATVVVAAYTGVSTSSPVMTVGGQVSASSSSIVAPSVTTTAGAQLVGLFGIARSTDLTAPAGMVERAEARASAKYVVTGHLADEPFPTAGATGTRTATAPGAAAGIGHLVALRPAG